MAAADLMRRHGLAQPGDLPLRGRAQNAGAPRDARLYRLLYPLGFPAALRGEAPRAGVDAPLVAALTRQESLFDPEATSAAGARGLMQVMPDVGKRVAKGLGYPEWDAVLLYQADANLEIGSTHLRALLEMTRGAWWRCSQRTTPVRIAWCAGGHGAGRRTPNC